MSGIGFLFMKIDERIYISPKWLKEKLYKKTIFIIDKIVID
jgi:hypothetical protein